MTEFIAYVGYTLVVALLTAVIITPIMLWLYKELVQDED